MSGCPYVRVRHSDPDMRTYAVANKEHKEEDIKIPSKDVPFQTSRHPDIVSIGT